MLFVMRNPTTIKSLGILLLWNVFIGILPVYAQDAEKDILLQGIELSRQGKFEEAVALYSKVIELNPQNADAYNNRATANGFREDFVAAISDFTKAIELRPNFAVAYYSRATALGVTGRFDEALADFGKAIEINARYGQAYADRAKIYYIKKEYQKSLDDVMKANELGVAADPEVVESLQKFIENPEPAPFHAPANLQ